MCTCDTVELTIIMMIFAVFFSEFPDSKAIINNGIFWLQEYGTCKKVTVGYELKKKIKDRMQTSSLSEIMCFANQQ